MAEEVFQNNQISYWAYVTKLSENSVHLTSLLIIFQNIIHTR